MTANIRDFSLVPGNTLIFLDEIQRCGNARTAIKFLAEDMRFDVISSGSLMGLTYGEDDDDDVEVPESIPVIRLILRNSCGLTAMMTKR